jgi:isopentenyl diphosphate isomerase/L-lactate dehydrogenase-like FMN-dependent dehydrogenase
MLTAALEGYVVLRAYIQELLHALRSILFLTGAASVAELRGRERVVTGRTAEWLHTRGLSLTQNG